MPSLPGDPANGQAAPQVVGDPTGAQKGRQQRDSSEGGLPHRHGHRRERGRQARSHDGAEGQQRADATEADNERKVRGRHPSSSRRVSKGLANRRSRGRPPRHILPSGPVLCHGESNTGRPRQEDTPWTWNRERA